MTAKMLLSTANYAMVITLVLFAIVAYMAWGMEAQFPLLVVAVLHLSQIILAGLFKLSYVFRLIAQSQLGEQLR